MAKILPAKLQPPARAISRSHRPKPAGGASGYQKYRACLRWDFGFTCPFCLQHETDIVPRGAEGTGLTTVEHRELQKDKVDARNDYENCIYACRFCNRDRHIAPLLDPAGRALLDPTRHAWAHHFELRDDELVPFPNDRDAQYTWDSYKPDQPRKVAARRSRREKISGALEKLRVDRKREKQLLAIAARLGPSPDAEELFNQAQEVRGARRKLVNELLQTYPLVPTDAPTTCHCKQKPDQTPPKWLTEQALTPRI
jgi:hypothetical protein